MVFWPSLLFFRFIFLILISDLPLFAATSPQLAPSPDAQASSVLRFQIAADPVSLDPSLAEDGTGLRILGALMKGLTQYDSQNRLQNAVAEKIEVFDGGRFYRVRLRQSQWSDGRPITAQDFLYSFQKMLSPQTFSKQAELFFLVKGAQNYKQGVSQNFSEVGIKARGDDILEFSLSKPSFLLPHFLALTVALPQRPDISDLSVTTGYYHLASWAHNKAIELVLNGRALKTSTRQWLPQRLIFQVISEESTALRLFDEKKIDIVSKISYIDLPSLKNSPYFKTFPYFATYYLGFNILKPPGQNAESRKLISAAIDRQGIARLLHGDGVAAYSWIPPEIHSQKYNPSEVKGVYSWGQKPIELSFDSGSRNQMIVEKIQNDLKLRIGLNVALSARDWKSHIILIQNGGAPLFRFGWLAPFIDPLAHLMVFAKGSLNNYTGWNNDRYDQLLSEIGQTREGPRRRALVNEAQDILLENEFPAVPIFHYRQSFLISKKVTAFHVNGIGFIDWASLKFDK